MVNGSLIKVIISNKEKTIKFKADSVELETVSGQIVILPGHCPFASQTVGDAKIYIKQESGSLAVLTVGLALAVFDSDGVLLIIKSIF